MSRSPLFGRGLGEAPNIMNLYPKLIHDALATVRYPGTGKNLIEAEMVEDDLRIDGQKVSFSLIFEKPTDPFMKSILKSAEAAIKREAGADVEVTISVKTIQQARPEVEKLRRSRSPVQLLAAMQLHPYLEVLRRVYPCIFCWRKMARLQPVRFQKKF